MVLLLDLILSFLIGIAIFLFILKFRKENFYQVQNLVLAFIESIFSGTTIYIGIVSIILAFTNEIPFGLTTVVNQNFIFLVAGCVIIFTTIWILFRKEIALYGEVYTFISDRNENSQISVERLNYIYSYLKYKNETGNPDHKVISISADGIISARTANNQKFFDKRLYFELKIQVPTIIEGQAQLIPSEGLAWAKIKTVGSISTFTIVKWFSLKEHKNQIKELKKNENFASLKPIIQIKPEYVADKYSLEEITKVKEAIDKLKSIDIGD
jgi:hypothetical protein